MSSSPTSADLPILLSSALTLHGRDLSLARAPSAFDHPWLSLAVATRFDSSSSAAAAAAAAPAFPSSVGRLLVDGIRSIGRTRGFAQPFKYPVDLVALPDYGTTVPVPMDLTTILCRLLGGYYRGLAAVEADLRLLPSNCLLYNLPDSEIAGQARRLGKELGELMRRARRRMEAERILEVARVLGKW